MIRSAMLIASAIADSNAGEGRPSHCASRRAARMEAAISRTRLRPSSLCFAEPPKLVHDLRQHIIFAFIRHIADTGCGPEPSRHNPRLAWPKMALRLRHHPVPAKRFCNPQTALSAETLQLGILRRSHSATVFGLSRTQPNRKQGTCPRPAIRRSTLRRRSTQPRSDDQPEIAPWVGGNRSKLYYSGRKFSSI